MNLSFDQGPEELFRSIDLRVTPVIADTYLTEILYGKYPIIEDRQISSFGSSLMMLSLHIYYLIEENLFKLYHQETESFRGVMIFFTSDYGSIRVAFQLKPMLLKEEYGLYLFCEETISAAREGRPVRIRRISLAAELDGDDGWFPVVVRSKEEDGKTRWHSLTDLGGRSYEKFQPEYDN